MSQAVALGLAELASEINRWHTAAEGAVGTALDYAREAGTLLLQAKEQIPHGEWLPWIAANFQGSERTAQAYMRVAKRWDELEGKSAESADLAIDGALKLLAKPRPDGADPKADFWKQNDARVNPLPGDDVESRPPRTARKPEPPASDVPPEFADYDPREDAPDPIEEWNRAQAEVDRLTATLNALEADGGPEAEVVRLTKAYGQLDGRLNHEMRVSGEAQKQATYQGKLLREIRELLGVERNREILPCIRDLLK